MLDGGTIAAATSGGLGLSQVGSDPNIKIKTSADGLGDNRVNDIYGSGTLYAATRNGVSIFEPMVVPVSPRRGCTTTGWVTRQCTVFLQKAMRSMSASPAACIVR